MWACVKTKHGTSPHTWSHAMLFLKLSPADTQPTTELFANHFQKRYPNSTPEQACRFGGNRRGAFTPQDHLTFPRQQKTTNNVSPEWS